MDNQFDLRGMSYAEIELLATQCHKELEKRTKAIKNEKIGNFIQALNELHQAGIVVYYYPDEYSNTSINLEDANNFDFC